MFLSVAKSAMGLYPFAFVMLMSLVFVFLCVPETRGLTLEEVMEKLALGGGGATKWTDNELAAELRASVTALGADQSLHSLPHTKTTTAMRIQNLHRLFVVEQQSMRRSSVNLL